MLTPKEKPYLEHLHSAYLDLDRLVVFLQREIGSGCIICRSHSRERVLFFSEVEIIGGHARENDREEFRLISPDAVAEDFTKWPFQVCVHFLDPNAVYHWEKLPPFLSQGNPLLLNPTELLEFVEKCVRESFSGLLDITLPSRCGALLFFDRGRRLGGSYSWGRGGLSPWQEDFEKLVAAAEHEGHAAVGALSPGEPLRTPLVLAAGGVAPATPVTAKDGTGSCSIETG